MNRLNKSINDRTETVVLRCDDNCTMLVVDKITWNEGDVDYNISMQESSFYDPSTLTNRIRNAWKCLFGKYVSYNDIYTDDTNKINKFVDEVSHLISK